MIQRVYEQTCAAEGISRVIVATDDDRVAEAVRAFSERREAVFQGR